VSIEATSVTLTSMPNLDLITLRDELARLQQEIIQLRGRLILLEGVCKNHEAQLVEHRSEISSIQSQLQRILAGLTHQSVTMDLIDAKMNRMIVHLKVPA